MSKIRQHIFDDTKSVESYNTWLSFTRLQLENNDYKEFNQDYKGSNFQYWKTFEIEGKKAYQIGVLFFDFRKHNKEMNAPEKISVQFECLLINEDSRVDLTISKDDMTLKQFEDFSKNFYYSAITKFKSIYNGRYDYSIDEIKPILMEVVEDYNIVNNRKRENVLKRMYIFYFLKNELKADLNLKKIGGTLGYNHASVLYNIERAKDFLEMEDSLFLSTIKDLRTDLFSKFKEHLKR